MTIEADKTEIDSIIAVAREAEALKDRRPEAVDPSQLLGLMTPAGELRVIDLEKHLAQPRRVRGTVNVHDPASLVAYVKKHADGTASALYANIDDSTITAVLNGHASRGDAGWGDHRAVFKARLTPEWQAWTRYNEKWLGQTDFANHIEANQAEITDPPAGAMLDMAQTLVAKVGVDFKQQIILGNGQRQFRYEETVTGAAGAAGTMKFPDTLTLNIVVYEGGDGTDYHTINVRLQFRIRDHALELRYLLDRPHDVLRFAFNDIVDQVDTETGGIAYRGTAPAPLQ